MNETDQAMYERLLARMEEAREQILSTGRYFYEDDVHRIEYDPHAGQVNVEYKGPPDEADNR